ncbi:MULTISPECIES: ATP-binding protein [unclassified Frankia]|uniref:ATP-binding protein n=1 Tax=unclassified Frankia TaxID=2632575 RepID=UPI002023E3C1
MDANTGGQDSALGPPGAAALHRIAVGFAAAWGHLEAIGVALACAVDELPTTAVGQAVIEERTEAVAAELRRLGGSAGMNLPSAVAPQPAAHLRSSVHQFAATTTAPALARHEVAQLLQTRGLGDLIDTAGLLVSELITNAVRATQALDSNPKSIVTMRLSWAAASLIIEVWDRSPQLPVLQDQCLDGEGGRGLHIVEALSLAAAYYPSPTGQGKVTWCQIEAPIPAEAEAPTPLLPYRRPSVARTDPGLVFDDLVVLRRVLDGLRALDTSLPRGDAVRY